MLDEAVNVQIKTFDDKVRKMFVGAKHFPRLFVCAAFQILPNVSLQIGLTPVHEPLTP
jgi:hypothetical protein